MSNLHATLGKVAGGGGGGGGKVCTWRWGGGEGVLGQGEGVYGLVFEVGWNV